MLPILSRPTNLLARRIQPAIPIWDVLADGYLIGAMSNLPMERGAWCLSARYRERDFDFRAATREAVLLALRCAVDAADYASLIDESEGYIEDEDGERARMRHEENLADAWSMRADMQEPVW